MFLGEYAYDLDTTRRKSVFLHKLADLAGNLVSFLSQKFLTYSFLDTEPDPYDDYLEPEFDIDIPGQENYQYTDTTEPSNLEPEPHDQLDQEFSNLFLGEALLPQPQPEQAEPLEAGQEPEISGGSLLDEIKARGIRREESGMIRKMSDATLFEAVFSNPNPKPQQQQRKSVLPFQQFFWSTN